MSRGRPFGRRAVGAAAIACAGAVAAGCGGSSASALGHRACLEVSASLHRYASVGPAATGSRASERRAAALTPLRAALPLAALAASSDGQWQALEATLSESSRVPEFDLVSALDAECSATLSPGG